MKISLRNLFVGLYAFSVMWLLIGLWIFFDLPYHSMAGILLNACWLLACFTGYRWLPSFYLSVRRVRKTILEEEEWLHPLIHEISLRCGRETVPGILILEKPDLEAFAIGQSTIVVSRGLIVKLSEHEIKAVLAHEYGHLRDKDTLAETVFTMVDQIPINLIRFGNMAFSFFQDVFLNKGGWLRKMLLAALITLLVLTYPGIQELLVFVILLKFVLPFLRGVMRVCWCWFSRMNEFRQDRFAQSLGYGRHLKAALLKIDALNSDDLVNRIRHLWLTHPLLYLRIRRIEWLEGLRSTL